MAKRVTDWEMIERDYRVGTLSVQMIAEKYGVDKVTIHRRAKKYAWSRDLSAQVQSATKAKVNAMIIADATATATETQLKRNSVDTFEVDSQANVNASIILSHQKDALAQKNLMHIMMQRLEDQSKNPATVEKILDLLKESDPIAYKEMYRASSLSTHVTLLKQLSETHEKIIKTEREAFNIDAKEQTRDESLDEVIKRTRAQSGYGSAD